MKVLTLTQPWATLIALGAKKIETRSWRTDYRGPLAIHAAAGLGPVGGKSGLWDLCSTEPFASTLREYGLPSALPLGAIVAVCELAGCYPTARTDGGDAAYMLDAGRQHRYRELMPVWGDERAFGDYSPGRWAWVLKNVRTLPEPIPAKGKLGLWEWDGELVV